MTLKELQVLEKPWGAGVSWVNTLGPRVKASFPSAVSLQCPLLKMLDIQPESRGRVGKRLTPIFCGTASEGDILNGEVVHW